MPERPAITLPASCAGPNKAESSLELEEKTAAGARAKQMTNNFIADKNGTNASKYQT
jgi:hypothetical protein